MWRINRVKVRLKTSYSVVGLQEQDAVVPSPRVPYILVNIRLSPTWKFFKGWFAISN